MTSPADSAVAFQTRAREFCVEHITPYAGQIDRDDRLPPSLLPALAKSGLMGVGIPSKFGGQGGNSSAVAAVLEELGASSAAVATLLSVHLAVCAAPIARWGTEAQRREYLPMLAEGRSLGAFALSEPGVGSDAAHLTCSYRKEPEGYRLRGSKMFITNAGSAGLILTFATKDPSIGSRGISAFLVPGGSEGLTVAQRLDKLGIRGSETTELVFDDVRLPPGSLLGLEGEGLHIALGALSDGRIGIAACALGVARAGLELMQRSAHEKPDDWKRAAVARAFVDVSAARALVQRAAQLQDDGQPFVEAGSAAKLYASQAAVRVASTAYEVVGDRAQLADSEAGRILRDARVFPIVEGTTEIQELILGRALVDK